MISTRFCPVCGAANNDTQTHCFACGQVLLESVEDEATSQNKLLHKRYRLGTTLGSGGYSAVYRGWDMQEGGRAVAIKQITLQGLGTEETIEATNTYNREVDALSALSHSQVPRLYDHFSDPDHWYLVLEYIEGQTLESYLEVREARGKPFQVEEVLRIGLQLCVVLSYLHSRHPPIIFRDLKPDNIMRTSAGKLYLIDFGIARHYTPGQSRDTQSLGSPGYAAPEQYGLAQTDVRTDLYGLGALLHQLLSGQDPSDTPRGLPPLRLDGQPGSAELEILISRLLASDPRDRPASAHDVARELERVRQRRISVLDSRRIWQPPVPQNYPTSNGSPGQAQQQFQYMQQAMLPKRKRLTRRRMLLGIGAASVALAGGFGAYTYLTAGINNDQGSGAISRSDYTYTGHSAAVYALAWSPDSQRIASASADKTVQIWGALDGANAYTYHGHEVAVNTVAWSPDGWYLASAGDNGSVRLLSAFDGSYEDMGAIQGYTSRVDTLAWEPGGSTYFATGSSDGTILIRAISSSDATLLKYQPGIINSIAYSPDGWYLASAADRTVVIWDTATDKRIYQIYYGHIDSVTCVTWLPNGVYLASASADETVRVWDPTSGGTLLVYQGHTAPVNAVASSPDGQYLASASDDGTVQVWSAYDGSALFTYKGHTAPVTSVAWSPDGNYIASGSADATVQVWDAPVPPSS